MKRRAFLQQTSLLAIGAMAKALPLRAASRGRRLGLSIASYRRSARFYSQDHPAWESALDVLDHCHSLNAGCLQIGVRGWTADFAGQVRGRRESLGIALEGQVSLPRSEEDLPVFEDTVRRAREAGATILRTVCLGGRRYETFRSLDAWETFKKDSLLAVERAEGIVRRHKVKLAVENHKDWRTEEQVAWLQRLGSEYLGVCFDFGNNLSLLEDPHQQLEKLAPYIMTTHLKDMGVAHDKDGFLLSEVPLGKGILDLNALCDRCQQSNPRIEFNLEMITRDPLQVPVFNEDYWITMPNLPARDLAWIWNQIKTRGNLDALPKVAGQSTAQRLAYEEANVRACFQYARDFMGF
jgi:sugar phosphate isomerase/epimerase